MPEEKPRRVSFADIEARKQQQGSGGEEKPGGLKRVTFADLAALSKRPEDFAPPAPVAEDLHRFQGTALEPPQVPRNFPGTPKELPGNQGQFQGTSRELPRNQIPRNVPRNLPGRRPAETVEDAFRLPVNRAPSKAELSRIRNRKAAITTALPMDLYDSLRIGVKELGGTVQSFVEEAIRERLAAFGYGDMQDASEEGKGSLELSKERSNPTLQMMTDEEYQVIINLFEELTGNSAKPADEQWKQQSRRFPVMVGITGMLKAYSWSNGPIQLFKYCYTCMEQVYADYLHRNNSSEWLRKLYREYWDRAEKRLGRRIRTLEEAAGA